MRFIKIGESYAINADRIVDVSYAAKAYAEERDADGWRDRTPAQVTIRIAGAVGVEERVLEGFEAENFWSNLVGARA